MYIVNHQSIISIFKVLKFFEYQTTCSNVQTFKSSQTCWTATSHWGIPVMLWVFFHRTDVVLYNTVIAACGMAGVFKATLWRVAPLWMCECDSLPEMIPPHVIIATLETIMLLLEFETCFGWSWNMTADCFFFSLMRRVVDLWTSNWTIVVKVHPRLTRFVWQMLIRNGISLLPAYLDKEVPRISTPIIYSSPFSDESETLLDLGAQNFRWTHPTVSCHSSGERSSQWQVSLQLVKDMTRKKQLPNLSSYSAVISSCTKEKHWEKAMLVIQQMDFRHTSVRSVLRVGSEMLGLAFGLG